jgi:Cellulose biosynthesis protein BcsS
MSMARLFLLCLLLAAGMQAQADGKLALAGAEYGGDNGYYYAGLLVPFPGSDLGNGFVQRYWVDWLRYEYENGNQDITAKAPGAAVALGYSRSAEAGSFGVYAGPVFRDTELSPDDRGSDVRGGQWGVNVSLQAERRLAERWRANGIASYTTGTDSYWTRGRLTRKIHSHHEIGIEAIAHGNDDYTAWQAGLVALGFQPAPHTSLGFKVGARKTSGEDPSGYLGVELARDF